MAWLNNKDNKNSMNNSNNPTPSGAPKPMAPPPPVGPRPMGAGLPQQPGAPRPLPPTPGSSGMQPPRPFPSATPSQPNQPPRPFGAPASPTPTPGFNNPSAPKPFNNPSMGPQPSFGTPGFNGSNNVPSPTSNNKSFSEILSNPSLDTILSSKKGYVSPKSLHSNTKITYDNFCREVTYEFLDNLLKSPNLLDHKTVITKIKKTLIFALTNTKDLPDAERELLYNATLRFVDFLKGVVYYPEKDKMNEEIITYLPFLKDTAYAFRSFLLKNR